MLLPTFTLPLPSSPPDGFGWQDRDPTATSDRTACNAGVDGRDTFSGQKRCIVCGDGVPLQHTHVIPQSQETKWTDLKAPWNWLPQNAKGHPANEPRNCMLMCPSCRANLDECWYFIRYIPAARKYILINYSNKPRFRSYHGKAVALDAGHKHSVFPQLLLIHEMLVRAHWPFVRSVPELPTEPAWQDWIREGGFGIDGSDALQRDVPSGTAVAGSSQTRARPPSVATGMSLFAGMSPAAGDDTSTLSDWRRLDLSEDTIAQIVNAGRSMPSWKACQIEGLSWNGTAEDNIRQYVSEVGLEEDA